MIDYYYCDYCGLELNDEECNRVYGYTQYANGEFACCPHCGEENSVTFCEE